MKQIQWTGLILFGLLGLAALVLYKERVVYVDSAYYAFNMINTEFPVAEHNRFALWLYQLLPWAMLKTGFAISLVLRAFSLSHILLHALVFAALLKIRQIGLAALLLLMQVLTYRECFFLTVNETALCISACLMLAGLLPYHRNQDTDLWKRILLYTACMAVALFSHPMALVLLPFVLVYDILESRGTELKTAVRGMPFVVFVLVFLLKKWLSSSSGYEDDLFAQLDKTPELLRNLSDVYSFRFFFGEFKPESYFFRIYVIPCAAFFWCLFRLLKQKQILRAFFYGFSVVGFWLLIVVLFNRGDGNIFMEKNFTPWVLTALYPLQHLIAFRGSRFTGLPLFLYLSFILYSVYGISRVMPMYQKRLYLMDRLITERNPGKAPKLIVQDSLIDHEVWLGIWALPYETLLLSRVKGIPNTSARIYRNEEYIRKELHRPEIFLGADFIPILPADALIRNPVFRLEEKPYLEIRNP